jgi:hypothetical protein
VHHYSIIFLRDVYILSSHHMVNLETAKLYCHCRLFILALHNNYCSHWLGQFYIIVILSSRYAHSKWPSTVYTRIHFQSESSEIYTVNMAVWGFITVTRATRKLQLPKCIQVYGQHSWLESAVCENEGLAWVDNDECTYAAYVSSKLTELLNTSMP